MIRIKKETLDKIINEEVNRRLLHEVTVMQELDPADLIDFADAWSSLGAIVQAQIKRVLDEGPSAKVNTQAIELALERLQGFNESLDQALQEWLDDELAGEDDRFNQKNKHLFGQGIPPSI